jgi:hypothetical protein
MISVLLAGALALATPDPFADRAFLHIRVDAMLSRRTRRIDVIAHDVPDQGIRFLFRRIDGGDGAPDGWATGETCPAAIDRLESLSRVALPTANVPGVDRPPTQIIQDGAAYTIDVHAVHPDGQPGDLRVTSNVGAPIAQWVDALSVALEPCWQPVRPPGFPTP